MKKTVSIIMSLLMVLLVFSCELTTPTVSDSGTIPYQRPDTPSNVKVVSGNKDKIVITWDPVENASYYVIEGAVSSDFGDRFSVFGNTTGTRFEISKRSEIRTDRSYLFTVRAVTAFSNGKTFVSLNSDYVEGALAPTAKDIQFYSVVTSDTVTSYWNVPTLFSTLHGYETLYDADFALGYKLASDESAPWTEIRNPEVDGEPWMFHQVSINEGALKQNEEYLFRVGMDIKDESGAVKNTVYSNTVKLMLHSDKLPSPITEIKVEENGLALDGITLTWTVPDWTLPLGAGNSFFKVERKEAGTEDWVKLIDETKNGKQSGRITRTLDESTGIISVSFKDDGISELDQAPSDISIIRDKKFIYRITNAASEGKVIFIQDKAPCESPEASVFSTSATGMNVTWTPAAGNHQADVTANWNFTDSLEGTGLVPVLITESKAEESEEWTIVRAEEYASGTAFTEEYGLGISDKAFRYSLELRKGSAAGDLYSELGMFPVEGFAEEYPSLKTDKIPAAVTYGSITAGTSVDGIAISWNIPEWKLPLSADNVFFKIERKEVTGSEWNTLVDETTYMEQDSRITRSVSGEPLTGSASFTDDDFPAIRDKKFVYRITNSAFHDGMLYVQQSGLAISSEGYVFEPELEADSLKMSWTEDPVQASASIHLSWNFLNDPLSVGLVPVIVTESYMPESDAWKNEGAREALGSMNQDFGDGITEKSFKYTFQLRKGSTEGEVYESFGYVPVDGMGAEQYPTIKVGETSVANVSDVTASTDRVGRVALQFRTLKSGLKYSYGIENAEDFTTAEAKSLGGDLYEIAVEVPDVNEYSIVLRAQEGKLLYSAPAVTGHALKTPDTLALSSKVTDGNSVAVSWNPASAVADIEYTAVYRAKGSESWTDVLIADFSAGTVSFETAVLPAGEYEYRMKMLNTKHRGEGSAFTDILAFDIMPAVEGITASKGSSADGITVQWNAVEKASGYEIFRYADDISGRTSIGKVENVLTFIDSASPDEARYTVTAINGENTGRLQTSFGTVKNPLLNDEEANLGYKFGTASFVPVSESHLTADNHLKDYFTVSFTPDRFIPVYTITATSGDISYEFDLSTFTASGMVRTNGKGAEEVGYAEYDPAADTFKANVRFGMLNDKLAVEEVAVTGKNGSLVSEKKSSTGDTLRTPSAADYAILFNGNLKTVIGSADSLFEGDWYGGPGAGDFQQRTYNGQNVKIGNTYADHWAGNQGNNGHIHFSGYVGTAMTLTSDTDIKLVSTNGGNAGYWGVDPLNIVGTNGGSNKTTAVITVNNKVGGKSVVYDDVSIRVNGITKYPGDDTSRTNWQGGYVITIGSGSEVNIPITDLKVKPY